MTVLQPAVDLMESSRTLIDEHSKRSDRRFIVNQPAQLTAPGVPGEVWQARIRDISRRGMQFIVDRPVATAGAVRIDWRNRQIHGTVRYQQQYGSEYRLGVELSSSWDSLVSDVLAQQAEELQASNDALQRTQAALRKSNDELALALELANQASQAKSRFLASISHELRTPMNGIIGLTQLLYDEVVGPISEDQKESLKDVLDCSDHLLSLINQVLDLTTIESGKMEFRYETVRLDELASSAIDAVKALAAAKRISVRLSVDERLGPVEADPARIRQVIFNYLSNALKFTPEGGYVCVELTAEPEGHRIAVKDNGIGIRAADLPRLFTEFGQLGAAEKAQEGTGLGLAITKRIVEAQGGRVGVESEFGRGSRFWAVLPGRR